MSITIEHMKAADFKPREVKYVDVNQHFPIFDGLYKETDDPKPLIQVGPKGVGKSLSYAAYARKHEIPLITFDCSEDVRRSQLVGMFILRGTETPFVLGPLTTAFEVANEHGQCIVILEEVNALTPQMQKLLNGCCDFRRRIEVPECKRVFELKKGAKVWFTGTMNTCFHPETDVLTPDGVKKVTELKAGDPVYSFNMEAGKVELDTVVNVWANWSDRLVRVSNQHVNLRVTPNHRLVVRRARGDKPWTKETVETMAEVCEAIRPTDTSWAYPKPFDLPDGKEQEMIDLARDPAWMPQTNGKYTCRTQYRMDDFLELLGWYVSEGSTYSGQTGEYKVYIAQNKPHGQMKIKAVLDRMEITFHEEKHHETGLVKGFTFNDKVLFHALRFFGGTYSEEKKIAHELFTLSKRQLGILFDAMYAGDGDEVKERTSEYLARTMKPGAKLFRSKRYSTKSPQLYKDTLWLATFLGYTTTRHAQENDGVGMYRIGLRPAKAETTHLEYEEVEYEGWVIDVEVAKNRTLFAGEDGKFLGVSNSVYGGVYALNEDLKSRVRLLTVNYPAPAEEKKILSETLNGASKKLQPKQIDNVLLLAHETRQNALDYALSTRDVVQVCEDIAAIGPERALRLALGKFDGDDRATVKARVESIFGVKVEA